MALIDWIIIAVFLISLISIGFFFSKRNHNLEDYFLGGRSMPTWLVAFAATGTSISAGTFVGSPELGFNTNLTYLMLCIGAILGAVASQVAGSLLPFALAAAAGAMVYVVIEEVIPEANASGNGNAATVACIGGLCLVMSFSSLVG